MNLWMMTGAEGLFLGANALILAVAIFVIYRFFWNRENQVLTAIQRMLDLAKSGEFRSEKLDESKLSAVEQSMKNYLASSSLTAEGLTEQKKLIQTMISDISHQSITPISNIILYSQLLEERGEDPCEEILAIKDQAEKLDFLIQSLVKLSRLETGMINTEVKEENLSKIWEAVKGQFLSKAQQKNILLLFEGTDIRAKFDLKWTVEAVANMVDNGIKYTPVGGTVTLRAEKYQFFARVDVMDTGMGIAEEEHGQIFSRFYRSPEVSDETGVGIGLFLTREILQAQNGYVKVSSEKGKGSVFSAFLPL